ncbi:nucleoplasmin-like [Heteronotia binoei]|uniref:nucleoplasmin-like n=1 Tax=Heteronotia binoei TaxID=13085 RepID=UPI00292E0984|nr:nucleoplasmin-like [Heteronotia binoei]XP_060106719.1 nucleoplasmin-like [Heteronotia binoei]XP_060106720.1 nucleoplasmin-like [Heteronotia binoei]XP_060106721.1 nucleoplasmin-like [Heteronotia binoei]
MALESSLNGSSRSEKTLSLVWGCELTKEMPIYSFDVSDDGSYEQQLALKTICLGEKANDEFHVVEIVPQKNSKESTPVCIANLKLSVLPTIAPLGLDLNPPVTFRLKSGSGPVYLAGQHLSAARAWNDSEVEEEESLEDEEMEESATEESPVKLIKVPAPRRSSADKKETEPAAQEQSQTKGATRGRKAAKK